MRSLITAPQRDRSKQSAGSGRVEVGSQSKFGRGVVSGCTESGGEKSELRVEG
jgi:hypothetical protein